LIQHAHLRRSPNVQEEQEGCWLFAVGVTLHLYLVYLKYGSIKIIQLKYKLFKAQLASEGTDGGFRCWLFE